MWENSAGTVKKNNCSVLRVLLRRAAKPMYQNILGACVAIVGHNIVVFCAFSLLMSAG